MKKNNFFGKTFVTNNFEETQQLGEDFAKFLEKGDVVALYGNLGSGKTTFVQGLAKGLGIKNRIISPTFVIVRSCKLGVMVFYHIDLYRMESARDIEGLEIEEIINDKNNIVVIEWAEKLKNYSSKKRIDINFSYKDENKRNINFSLGF